MNVSLPGELAAYVDREVRTGDYGSASEVVRDAIRLLKRSREEDREKLRLLRQHVQVGIDHADRGRFAKESFDELIETAIAANAGK
jgi:antitoxin ParD1/3/4